MESKSTNAMSSNDEETLMYAMHLAGGSVLPMVVKAVIELGILEILAGDGPLSGAEIAAKLLTSNPAAGEMVDRMLRLLACCSAVNCSFRDGSDERIYGLSPVSKFLIKNDHGVSFANFHLLVQDKVYVDTWYGLKDAILEGGVPFEKTHNGMGFYEYVKSDKRFGNIFNKAMSGISTTSMRSVVESYKGFEGLNTVVDVGGGNGGLLAMIIEKYPSINKAINFDLPHVIQNAPTYPGVEHLSGDMFVNVPPGDAIIMKWIMHNWSDEHCLNVLKNCYNAITNNGKLIVIEYIISGDTLEECPMAQRVVRFDVIMLALLPEARERTANEYETLAKAAGFKGFRVACNDFSTTIMEFLKY